MKTWRRSDEHYTCRLSRIRFIASLSDDDLFFFSLFLGTPDFRSATLRYNYQRFLLFFKSRQCQNLFC